MLVPLFVLAAGAIFAGYLAEDYFVGDGRAASSGRASILVLPGARFDRARPSTTRRSSIICR